MTAHSTLLDRVLAGTEATYALICQASDTASPRSVRVVTGSVSHPERIAGIPISDGGDTVILVPYRQIIERGFPAVDDGSRLVAISVTESETYTTSELLDKLPRRSALLRGGEFDADDASYARSVRQIIDNEVGSGRGANFVLKRTFTGEIVDYSADTAFSAFADLLEHERSAYWTFLLHTEDQTLLGASPERHITVSDGSAMMNPISGTYRYPASGPTLQGVREFLADRKETEELFMVVDEELKMMCRVCAPGSTRVTGPFLKEMAWLAHTEYFITGATTLDFREILKETLFAPTVTGSPVESATEVITRYEPAGRGYYSGIIGVISAENGTHRLDSAILIRSARIDTATGRLHIPVGATVVRHSVPAAEAAETRAKATALLRAFHIVEDAPALGHHPEVFADLQQRTSDVAEFWTRPKQRGHRPPLSGLKALVIDAEDTFTSMLDHQLQSLGLSVTVRRFDEEFDARDHDLVIVGPGPGDPRETDDPKIARLGDVIDSMVELGKPFITVCLSHQILCRKLGLQLIRRTIPNQGKQQSIDLFGKSERVGFYNTFEARSNHAIATIDGIGSIELARDPETSAVHAVRGNHFSSIQFHAESLLTVDGPRILANLAEKALLP